MFRLGEMYLVDMISRIIDYRIQFHRYNQHTLFGHNSPNVRLNTTEYTHTANDFDQQNDDEINNDGEENYIYNGNESDESKTFLSQSFHGSKRHLLSLAQNALCLVSEYGRPTLFITLTCNPYWTEIKEMLLGETTYDRADITCKVFPFKT